MKGNKANAISKHRFCSVQMSRQGVNPAGTLPQMCQPSVYWYRPRPCQSMGLNFRWGWEAFDSCSLLTDDTPAHLKLSDEIEYLCAYDYIYKSLTDLQSASASSLAMCSRVAGL